MQFHKLHSKCTTIKISNLLKKNNNIVLQWTVKFCFKFVLLLCYLKVSLNHIKTTIKHLGKLPVKISCGWNASFIFKLGWMDGFFFGCCCRCMWIILNGVFFFIFLLLAILIHRHLEWLGYIVYTHQQQTQPNERKYTENREHYIKTRVASNHPLKTTYIQPIYKQKKNQSITSHDKIIIIFYVPWWGWLLNCWKELISWNILSYSINSATRWLEIKNIK